jgi:anhydro-N-acetylmuramic acid kinase
MAHPYYIGVMSGTSMDGVDVALCKVEEKGCELIDAQSFDFPKALKKQIVEQIEGESSLSFMAQLGCKLGHLFADAIEAFLKHSPIPKEHIEAVGVHGQTVWHAPGGECPTTMQVGDATIVAAKTGLKVVADFRSKDVALGGEGAPLAPAFHAYLFNNDPKLSVVNIGGMANITVLGTSLVGYDTGPGNVLLDSWITKEKQLPYDKEGAWAKEGCVNYMLLEKLLSDAYFIKSYPKSTGREQFHLKWLETHLEGVQIEAIDVQATLVELTAQTIANEVLRFQSDVTVLCGGGANNSYLVERIKAMMPNIEVVIATHSEMLEAMMMAWLAYKRVHRQTVAIKEVTGARENTILGGIYE